MIDEQTAQHFAEPLLALPFAPTNAQIIRRIVLAFRDSCADRAHAHRALEVLLERHESSPAPAAVIAAIRTTVEFEEVALPPRRANHEIAWRCTICKDTGLYSRDVTLRGGEIIAVCGPCECGKGADRAAAYACREQEKRS